MELEGWRVAGSRWLEWVEDWWAGRLQKATGVQVHVQGLMLSPLLKFGYVKTWVRACEGKCVICSSRLDVLRALMAILEELNIWNMLLEFLGTQGLAYEGSPGAPMSVGREET